MAITNNRVMITGRLAKGVEEATVTASFGAGGVVTDTRTYTVSTDGAVAGSLVPFQFAQQKLAYLLMDKDGNADMITKMGKEFSIVTPGTSLIVLESLDQYVRHEIEPPATLPLLVDAYQAVMATRAADLADAVDAKLATVIQMWTERCEWYNTEFDTSCKICSEPLGGGCRKIAESFYHNDCLKCATCQSGAILEHRLITSATLVCADCLKCSQCGAKADQMYHSIAPALCRKCHLAAHPCKKCGKTVRTRGRDSSVREVYLWAFTVGVCVVVCGRDGRKTIDSFLVSHRGHHHHHHHHYNAIDDRGYLHCNGVLHRLWGTFPTCHHRLPGRLYCNQDPDRQDYLSRARQLQHDCFRQGADSGYARAWRCESFGIYSGNCGKGGGMLYETGNFVAALAGLYSEVGGVGVTWWDAVTLSLLFVPFVLTHPLSASLFGFHHQTARAFRPTSSVWSLRACSWKTAAPSPTTTFSPRSVSHVVPSFVARCRLGCCPARHFWGVVGVMGHLTGRCSLIDGRIRLTFGLAFSRCSTLCSACAAVAARSMISRSDPWKPRARVPLLPPTTMTAIATAMATAWERRARAGAGAVWRHPSRSRPGIRRRLT